MTLEDLIKYGFARDIEPVKAKALEERNRYYDERIAGIQKTLEERRAVFERANWSAKDIRAAEKTYADMIASRERDRAAGIKAIEDRFAAEARQYERRLQDPNIIRQVGEKQAAEIRAESERTRQQAEAIRRQTEELQERARVETETTQRESAERQAGRVRARSGRGASRQMLASARLSPQPMGVGGQSTLGTAPF